jgi:ureidoglycolate hydrolase
VAIPVQVREFIVSVIKTSKSTISVSAHIFRCWYKQTKTLGVKIWHYHLILLGVISRYRKIILGSRVSD